MIYIGNNKISTLKLGNTKIAEVYKGNIKIYPPTPSTISLITNGDFSTYIRSSSIFSQKLSGENYRRYNFSSDVGESYQIEIFDYTILQNKRCVIKADVLVNSGVTNKNMFIILNPSSAEPSQVFSFSTITQRDNWVTVQSDTINTDTGQVNGIGLKKQGRATDIYIRNLHIDYL